MHLLFTILGLNNPSGYWYLSWSGWVGCLIYLGIFATLYKKLNCHQTGCYRIGLHKVGNGTLIVCKKHHPAIPSKVLPEHIQHAHNKYHKK
jgi:hypothetical protein